MNKTELEQKIKNGESVWYTIGNYAYEVDTKKHTDKFLAKNGDYLYTDENKEKRCCPIKLIYKTKAEAEHYLNHTNVTRTEQLPFLTWEEFLEETRLNFIACDGVSNMMLYCCNNTIYLVDEEYPEFNTTSWELTEENFYKAYDECVRLFRGE